MREAVRSSLFAIESTADLTAGATLLEIKRFCSGSALRPMSAHIIERFCFRQQKKQSATKYLLTRKSGASKVRVRGEQVGAMVG